MQQSGLGDRSESGLRSRVVQVKVVQAKVVHGRGWSRVVEVVKGRRETCAREAPVGMRGSLRERTIKSFLPRFSFSVEV
jgi:hypothetical protein